MFIKIKKIPFVETPNWGASFDHNNPRYELNLLIETMLQKNNNLTKQDMVVFNKFLKTIHDVFITLYTFNMIF